MSGYCEPPIETRFKKGVSNPKAGRKKGSLNVKNVIKKILNEEIEVTQCGNRVKKTMLEIGCRKQIERWISGDNLAGRDLLDRVFGKATEKMEMSGTMNVNNITEILKEWRKKPEKDSAD